MSVVVMNHVSLDGVLQGPGRPDEDTRGGFRHGGWAGIGTPDPVLEGAMGAAMGPGFRWLFGHRSYDDMLLHWNAVGGPFKDGLNAVPKYVASRDPAADLPWPNSELVTGDVPRDVARLRDDAPGNVVVMGSGELVRSLLPHGLVDTLLLFTHPVVLGSGQRLFGADDEVRHFRLVDVAAGTSGVVVSRFTAG